MASSTHVDLSNDLSYYTSLICTFQRDTHENNKKKTRTIKPNQTSLPITVNRFSRSSMNGYKKGNRQRH